jgi:hypothetical protein
MNNVEKEQSGIEKAGEDLFEYAIDREDVKWLMAQLSMQADIRRTTVEYELQILKIVSVGWSTSFYLENMLQKTRLSESYWQTISDYSRSLSETTGLMIGQDIDYFQTLKDRLDMYVAAMSRRPESLEPAVIIGKEFARICGNADDLFTFMTGSKMFISTTSRVKAYLQTIELG